MKKLLHIAVNELVLLRKDRMAATWMLLLPLGITLIGGVVFGALDGGEMANQIVPGYAVMFAMFSVLSAAGGILEEKERGTFKRLLIAPIPEWSLLGGKLVAQFLIGVGQIFLMFLFGMIVFGMNAGNSPLGLLLITLATCWATTSLGILLVAVIRSRKQIHPITTFVILGSSAIGGSWFPLFMMPKWLQQVARITLVAWAMEGYNRLMILGGVLADVWLDIGVLVLYGAICFGIGVKLFRFKEA
jgi:ABC-2 type transport system permease protein